MLDKLKKWLFKKAETGLDKVMITCGLFLVNMLWLLGMVKFLTYINEVGYEDARIPAFFYACIMAPLWEELAFRVIPISIARKFGEQFIIPVVILSSLIFGWGHGNGTNSLLIQGVGGLLLSVVYIKTNYNYWCSVAMHFAWNFWIIFLTPTF